MDNSKTALENFLKTCKGVETAFPYLDGHIKDCELKTQDFLHALELEVLDHHKMARLSKKEKLNRKERRAFKDEKALLLPLAVYLESPAGKAAIAALQRILGDIRREETRQASRIYRKKMPEIQEKTT